MRRVIVLRPEPGASATVERARAHGLDAVGRPLFAIDPVEWRAPDPSGFDGLLLTSANAVRCGGEKLRKFRRLPVYAVGEATAEALREVGFGIAATGDTRVERLLGSIDTDLRLLHLCGEDRTDLGQARQSIEQIVVYRSKPIEAPDLSGTLGGVVLIHSPRAGRRFSELANDRGSIIIAAISAAAAGAVGTGWERVEAANNPTDHALLALAVRLCNNSPPK
jgi:uroporphyrinogen-III synthase